MDSDRDSLSRTVPVPLQRGHVMAGFAQRRAQALTRHFEQAEAGNMANLNTRPVLTHRFTQTVSTARW